MRKFYSMKNLAIALVVALAMPATVQAENESNLSFPPLMSGLNICFSIFLMSSSLIIVF